MAGARSTPDGTHHNLGNGSRWPQRYAPTILAGGGIVHALLGSDPEHRILSFAKPLVLLSAGHGTHRSQDDRRIENREGLTRGQIALRLIESLRFLDFRPRDREVGIDLSRVAAFSPYKIARRFSINWPSTRISCSRAAITP